MKKTVLLVAFGVMTNLQIQAQQTLSLTEAINLAYTNNESMQIARAEIEKAGYQVNEAWGSVFPTISGNLRYTRNVKKPVFFLPDFSNPESGTVNAIEVGSDNSYLMEITANQTIWSSTVNTALQVAEIYENFSREGLKETRQETRLNVTRAYFGTLLSKQIYRVTQKVYDLTVASNDNIQAMYQEGMASEYDALRSSVQVANTFPQVLQAEKVYELSMSNLKILAGIPDSVDLNLSEAFQPQFLTEEDIQTGKQRLLSQNALLNQLKVQKDLLTKNIEINQSEFWPSLYAFGRYAYQTEANDFKLDNYNWVSSASVGLTLSIPIFSGLQRYYRVEQARIEARKADYQIQQAEDQLLLSLQDVELRLKEAKRRIEAQSKSVGQAEKALKIAEVRYQNGIGLQLEVMDAQVALSRTLTNEAQAIYDYIVARAEWEKLINIQ